MSVYDSVDALKAVALERSKKYNEGTENHAFAFGWFAADMQAILDEMGLSKKQMKVLEDRIVRLNKILAEDA